MCRECHTETLSGQSVSVTGLMTLAPPNLTAGAGGVGAANTDQHWVRAIRHGVGHEGRGLALMPARAFYYLSDEDLGALVAYLMSLPLVDNQLPGTDLGPLGHVMIALRQLAPEILPNAAVVDHYRALPVTAELGVTAEDGKYLTRLCMVCHGENLNGQTTHENGAIVAPNLTLGGESVSWSETDFSHTLRTGVTPNPASTSLITECAGSGLGR